MKFTVLGASGFIGGHLTAVLRAAGHDVYAPARNEAMLAQPLGHVLYCIGLTADFRSRCFDTMRAHVSILTEILERADFESLLYLSSTRVYAGAASGAESARLTVDIADPSYLYNLSKLAGESLCHSCGRDNVRVARLSNVVGPDSGSENFLSALIREALSGRIELQTDPESAKDYVLLDDVIAVLPRIAAEGHDWLYNVAGGISLRHRDLVQHLAELTGCEVAVRAEAPRQDFPAIEIARIQSEFGFSPASVVDRLPQLVAAYRAQDDCRPHK